MAVSGMTGFGRAEGAAHGVRWIWEAKSVNGRGLDVKLRLPPGFDALEPVVREAAAKRFKRGSLQANLNLRREESAAVARLDKVFIEALIDASKPYVAAGAVAAPRWDGLLQVRGAFSQDDEAEQSAEEKTAFESVLIGGVHQAFDALNESRRAEGRTLAGVFGAMIDRVDNLVALARAEASAAPEAIVERLRTRLQQLAPEIQIDPQRFAQEAALIAARADVAEELERLAAHAAEARSLIAKPEPAGRRLDFLAQELTREANTLCSKSSELTLTRIGLDLKTVIDQLKEQAANVE
ncbi:MAG: YicC/YloC family endoribonuclease [Caulobacterales bacterium]